MKIWFDTEFIEDGKTIDLISIGLVREDGATLYLENAECNHDRASDWVRENVLPRLTNTDRASKHHIAKATRAFVGHRPEFWAYYASYDWVALCQLYGTMMDLPDSWPMFCMDLRQWAEMLGNPELPALTTAEHHALADALWARKAWYALQEHTLNPP